MNDTLTPASEAIGPKLFQQLVKSGAVKKVTVHADGFDFVVFVHFGTSTLPLATFRGNVRNFKTIQTVLTYLHEMGVPRFEVDATNYPRKNTR